MERGVVGAGSLMAADYYYYPNGLLERVEFGNGYITWYEYDDANRLTSIRHQLGGGLEVEYVYTWTDNDLPETITEKHETVPVATTSFIYDNRGRLIHEWRTWQDPYNLSYAYDNNGNRKTKTDALNDVRVDYEYDIDDPLTYGTANNRLMYYETWDITGPEVGVLSTTWYYYNPFGNVSRIVTNVDGTEQYSSTWLIYARNGETVSYVVGETWTWDGVQSCPDPEEYAITFAREFRYDGSRERYLNRELDPSALLSGNIVEVAAGTYWSDYGERSEREWAAIGKASRDARDRPTTCPEQVSTMRTCGGGGDIYGDYTVDQGTATETMSFQLGLARTADPLGTPATDYYHTDHLGTTREVGYGVGMRTLTAFGEHVAGQTGRYDYAGAWGYQTHDDFPFLHVGARYYDPATGRFLQRDPIAIIGGPNVYAYVRNAPTIWVDPFGLKKDFIERLKDNTGTGAAVGVSIGGTAGAVAGGIAGSGLPGAGTLVGVGAGATAGGAAGATAGALCGAFYTVGEELTPVVDWIFSWF